MSIKNLKIGKSGIKLAVRGEKILRKRLLETGITPHTTVTVKKAAPLGDPLSTGNTVERVRFIPLFGSLKGTLFVILYQTGFVWLATFCVYQIGSLLREA